jgi:hypothetical protein
MAGFGADGTHSAAYHLLYAVGHEDHAAFQRALHLPDADINHTMT